MAQNLTVQPYVTPEELMAKKIAIVKRTRDNLESQIEKLQEKIDNSENDNAIEKWQATLASLQERVDAMDDDEGAGVDTPPTSDKTLVDVIRQTAATVDGKLIPSSPLDGSEAPLPSIQPVPQSKTGDTGNELNPVVKTPAQILHEANAAKRAKLMAELATLETMDSRIDITELVVALINATTKTAALREAIAKLTVDTALDIVIGKNGLLRQGQLLPSSGPSTNGSAPTTASVNGTTAPGDRAPQTTISAITKNGVTENPTSKQVLDIIGMAGKQLSTAARTAKLEKMGYTVTQVMK